MEDTCPNCKGLGYTVETNIMRAIKEKKPCIACRGTGKIQIEKPDGKRFITQECIVGYWQEMRAGKVAATLHIHVCPIRDSNTGKPLFKPGVMNPKGAIPRVFIQIVNMVTKPKYRKTGIMSELLAAAMADPKIEWVETSWDDSTADGRNFLLGKGFVQEGKDLIFKKTTDPVIGS